MIDPITLALIGTGVSAASSLIGSGIQGAKGRQVQREAKAFEDQLRSQGMPKMETPQEYFDLYEKAKENKAAQIASQQASQRFADVSQALQTGGLRGMGALQSVARSADLAQNEIAAQSQQQELNALSQLAGAQAQTGALNTQLGARQYMQDLQNANISYGAGLSMGAQATGNALAAIGSLGSTAASLGTMGLQNPDAWMQFIGKDGMKTPGEFSHSKNPISLVDKDGVKVGEATGGEYIFNPTQSKKLKQLASQGDTELHKYVGSLLKKFDKK